MTVLYLETSALLSWLFDESEALTIVNSINEADLIVTSELLRIETMRAFRRALHEKLITPIEHGSVLDNFQANLKSWFRMSIDESVVGSASQDFPAEPVRSLDAIHLSTALEYKKLYPEVKMLTTDNHIRTNAAALDLLL